MYTTGLSWPCSSWSRTAPIPCCEASVCTVNIFSKSGLCRTGSWHNAPFKSLKAFSQSSVHTSLLSWVFFVKFVRVIALAEKFGINFLYQPISPRKALTCFFVSGRPAALMASTFPTWGRITPLPSTKPKYWVSGIRHCDSKWSSPVTERRPNFSCVLWSG